LDAFKGREGGDRNEEMAVLLSRISIGLPQGAHWPVCDRALSRPFKIRIVFEICWIYGSFFLSCGR